MTENKTQQQAGDAATQIGSVGGNVVQHINRQMGLWGCLAASIVAAGLFFCIVYAVEKIWPTAAEDGFPPGESSAVGSYPYGDFGEGGTNAYSVLAGGPAVSRDSVSTLPVISDQLAQAQLRNIGAQIMQYADWVETQAVATNNMALPTSAFGGQALASLQQRIGTQLNNGLSTNQILEQANVLDVRVVGSTPWGPVIEIDTCEVWSSETYDSWGGRVDWAESVFVPQRATVEYQNGWPYVTRLDTAVSFPDCP